MPSDIDDAELERRLFVPAGFHDGPTRPLPDWTKVHEELKRRGVTLMLLWEEHRLTCPDGHGYSQFCELYLVERFFCKLKQYRAIATRYDKLANTFLAAVALVCVLFWLN